MEATVEAVKTASTRKTSVVKMSPHPTARVQLSAAQPFFSINCATSIDGGAERGDLLDDTSCLMGAGLEILRSQATRLDSEALFGTLYLFEQAYAMFKASREATQ